MSQHPLEQLADVVAPTVLVDTELGVPHALIGGLAVGVHGHPRATKDVDFLVGNEAFSCMSPILVFREELRDFVRIGEVDLTPLPADHPELAAYLSLPTSGGFPVISVSALVLLKLQADHKIEPTLLPS
jgi:hypothetical protein